MTKPKVRNLTSMKEETMSTTAISSALLGVSQTSSSTTTETTDTTSTDFLTLLLAELENQDPTNPISSAELTSQLATLSQVEQSIKTNEYLAAMTDYMSSTNNAGAVSCIGKTVTADKSDITVSSGVSESLAFTLAEDADQTTITIRNEDGNTVKTISCENLSSGNNTVTWDGTDSNGKSVADGTYSFSVAATDSDGNSVTAATTITAQVTGVSYNNGVTYLVTDSGKIAYGDVTQINSST
jgi:flagellar basal-body rod modification protein FlgD